MGASRLLLVLASALSLGGRRAGPFEHPLPPRSYPLEPDPHTCRRIMTGDLAPHDPEGPCSYRATGSKRAQRRARGKAC